MTFYNINENHSNMVGRFGSRQSHNVRRNIPNIRTRKRILKNIQIPRVGHISVVGWIDIICISIISIFLICVILNWDAFLDLFFLNVLFPFISTGTAIIGGVLGIGAAIGFIYIRLRRPRRW